MVDTGTTERLYGNYRAKVVDNKDLQQFGRILVWIPDLMESVEPTKGIWARPANNPLGGRNKQGDPAHHFMGTSYIPRNGAWVWIFFEVGNINRPYYFGALDLENTKVLPENQLGTNYQDKWTVFKSHDGRTIIISDDPDDARIEITGKKRKMNNPPTGDTDSVYEIDENQTTILFDERDGKEKILVRTYKGDFIHIDIDEQSLQIYFKEDIEIKTDGNFFLTAEEDINILSQKGNINIEAENGDINIKAAVDLKEQSGKTTSVTAGQDAHLSSGYNINHRAGQNLNQDAGAILNDQTGASSPGDPAEVAQEAVPQGERDT
jgi:hypothetical protein